MESLSVVIIEDEMAHFQLLKRAISKDLPLARIFHFVDARSFLDNLDASSPDIIIADYLTPGMNALDLLSELNEKNREIPVIVVTGQGDEMIAVKAMKLGAWDYMVKSADFFSLVPSVIDKVVAKLRLQRSLRESARLNELLLDSLPHPAMLIRQDRSVIAANKAARDMGVKLGGPCWREFGKSRFIPEKDKEYIRAHSGEAPPGGSKCAFCLADEALAEKRPKNAPEIEAFKKIWDTWWIPIGDKLFFHYALDITERRQTEKAIQASHRLLEVANRHTEMGPLLNDFIAELALFTGCHAVGIRILDRDGGILYSAHQGFGGNFSKVEDLLLSNPEQSSRENKGAFEEQLLLHTEGGSVYTNHAGHLIASVGEDPEGGSSSKDACFESAALIPVKLGERTVGLLSLAEITEDKFSHGKVELIEKIAAELSAAIRRVHSEEALRKSEKQLRFLSSKLLSAQEEERRRLACELHDSLGSSLSAIKISCNNVRKDIEEGAASAESMDIPIAWLQYSMEEIRRIITDLRPSILDKKGIIATIEWLCDQFRSMHPQVEIELETSISEDEAPDALKTVIFRVLQEALGNIAKHSRAGSASVSLRKIDNSIELLVRDNGEGFDLGSVVYGEPVRGLGLTSMRERVELSGGIFVLDSKIGKGTAIRAVWK